MGRYGGAAFVLVYLLFLVILGLPIMVMEFAVGRASRKSAAVSFNVLEPKGTRWHLWRYGAMAGNYLLMMFYTTVGGWMLSYMVRMFRGDFGGLTPEEVGGVFGSMLGEPVSLTFWMAVTVLLGFGVCSLGLQKGVERVTKVMMTCLLLIMAVLVIRSVTLDGAAEGLKFYLVPNFRNLVYDDAGNFVLFDAVYAAMGQSFFTLSLGIGAMAIFGSYIGADRSLTGEALNIGLLDTCVALVAGLIIFPACFAFDVNPGEGPGLVFVTLPNIFNQMPGGRIWGGLFFLFLSFAALSTIIAVFENIISFAMDLWGWSRKKAVLVNLAAILLLSMPCVLGYSLWSGFTPLGMDVQTWEDFLISNNLLPIGSLVYLLFCVSRRGWGWDKFLAEADRGAGAKFPRWARGYLTYVLPLIVLVIFLIGYHTALGIPVWLLAALAAAVLVLIAAGKALRKKKKGPIR